MQQQLVDFILQKMSELSHIPTTEINIDEPIMNLGLSSFLIAEVNLAVEEKFGMELPFMAIAEGASIRKLAEESLKDAKSNEA